MDRDLLFVVLKAAIEAAIKISKSTPTITDDRILLLAQAILESVEGVFGDGNALSTEESIACATAAVEIRNAIDAR